MDHQLVHDAAIWALCAVAVVGVLARPFGVPEWIWALGAAAVVAITRLLSPSGVLKAIGDGGDVYLFLAGMMVLAELARIEGVFDWVAGRAIRASGGSRLRLLAIVYGVGIVVTTVLSNDATAVVLTPAVAAAAKAAKVRPLPHLFACALIANAASFVLPISNPANLVVFAADIPPLGRWLAAFALPSLCAIVITFVVVALCFRGDLRGEVERGGDAPRLATAGKGTLAGIGVTAVALVTASAFGANLGLVTAICGAVVYVVVVAIDRRVALPALRDVSWPVLALVAGLFVLVAASEETGLLTLTRAGVAALGHLATPLALVVAAFVPAIGANLVNNLPAGLIAGTTVTTAHAPDAIRSAVAIGIDLGPNLSVTGSLATILWLLALRRDEIEIDAWHFLRVGALAMPPALLVSTLALLATAR